MRLRKVFCLTFKNSRTDRLAGDVLTGLFLSLRQQQPAGLPPDILLGGKSGQHRAPYFLTGSCLRGQSSVTENNRSAAKRNKGEKAR